MIMPQHLANHYKLEGDGISVVYGQDFGGNPHIVYNGKAYTGVVVSKNELGLVASVVIDFAPDSHTVYLSLIIPPVNLSAENKTELVSTQAVFATHKTTIGGDELVSGQTIEYRFAPLSGTASHVIS